MSAGSGLTFRLVGKKSRSARIACASVSMKSRRASRHRDAARVRATPAPSNRAITGGIVDPVDRRAVVLELHDLVEIGRQRQRHLAGHDEIGEQRVALAHRDAVRGDDVAEQLQAALLADRLHQAAEPVAVVGLDAELALPLAVGEVVVALRQIVLLDEPRVVGGDEDVVARADPFAVRTDRRRREIGERRRCDLLQQLLAVERFHRGGVGLEDVDVEAVAARLRRRRAGGCSPSCRATP